MAKTPLAGFGRLAIERRVTEQLILYWNKLRKERRFPSIDDISPDDMKYLWQDCFIVEIKDIFNEGDTQQYKHIGENIKELFGIEVTLDQAPKKRRHSYKFLGENIQAMFSGGLSGASAIALADNLFSRYVKIAETRQPIVDESIFINEENAKIKYRQILLPLGTSDSKVDHIIGGMRHRLC